MCELFITHFLKKRVYVTACMPTAHLANARETSHVGLIHLRYVRQSEIHMKIWLSR